MHDLIKLVKTFRVTEGLAERLKLAEEIFPLIQSDLRFFVYAALRPPMAEDVFQEVLKAIFVSLGKFKGNSTGEFWAWCYRIARNKLHDQYGKQTSDRLQPMPTEELWNLVDAASVTKPLSAAGRHDLDYAMNQLTRAKPECRDMLWNHFIFGLDYTEMAADQNIPYDTMRMKIGRCLEKAQSLVA